jgi:hypothetical protein
LLRVEADATVIRWLGDAADYQQGLLHSAGGLRAQPVGWLGAQRIIAGEQASVRADELEADRKAAKAKRGRP